VGIILFGFVGITLCSKKVTKKHYAAKQKQNSHHWFWEVIFFYWNYILQL
jgi:hypothetical protein